MIVCSCHVVSDRDVRAAVHSRGLAGSTAQVYRNLGHRPQCGRCAHSIRDIMDEALAIRDTTINE
jgi:bacterioferritin-associated ferredoxin